MQHEIVIIFLYWYMFKVLLHFLTMDIGSYLMLKGTSCKNCCHLILNSCIEFSWIIHSCTSPFQKHIVSTVAAVDQKVSTTQIKSCHPLLQGLDYYYLDYWPCMLKTTITTTKHASSLWCCWLYPTEMELWLQQFVSKLYVCSAQPLVVPRWLTVIALPYRLTRHM